MERNAKLERKSRGTVENEKEEREQNCLLLFLDINEIYFKKLLSLIGQICQNLMSMVGN